VKLTSSDDLLPVLSCVRELQQQVALARLAIGTGDRHRAIQHLQNAQSRAHAAEIDLASFAEA
jgi:hypothetical protein